MENKQTKNMENLQITITITDGENEAKAIISLDEYKSIKEMHGISMLDEQVNTLLELRKKKLIQNPTPGDKSTNNGN